MQKLPDLVPALSHHLKPLMRDGSQFTGMLFHPRIDGRIPLDSAVESQQFCSHHLSTFCFRELWLRNGRFVSKARQHTVLVHAPCPSRLRYNAKTFGESRVTYIEKVEAVCTTAPYPIRNRCGPCSKLARSNGISLGQRSPLRGMMRACRWT